MPIKYQKVWDTMNDLEMIISKVVSAREMIDIANEAISVNDQDRAEAMTMAAYEFLGYFIEEFDKKFKDAWKATVGDLRDGDVKKDDCMPPWGHSDLEYLSKHKEHLICNKDDTSLECEQSWNDFWEDPNYGDTQLMSTQQYTDDELDAMCSVAEEEEELISKGYFKEDGSWKKPKDKVVKWILPVEEDDPSGTYYITFPDDLLEASNLKEGDQVEWIDQGDGSFKLIKIVDEVEDESVRENDLKTVIKKC
jgi:hypothetical protein